MNSNEFINKLKEIAKLPTTYYSVAGGDWAKWNGSSWNFDCVILIKAILWGWNGNKNHSHGGANYGTNGVYDDGTEQIINRCTNISTDFSNIAPGELLWLPGHVGVYIGNGEVIECTAAWESKVLYSHVDKNGNRTRNNSQVLKWQKHGKLPYIDYIYITEKNVDNNIDVFYKVKTQKHGWLPEVKNLEDYAGWEDSPIIGLAIKTSKGRIRYRVHVLGGDWLPWVDDYDITDIKEGYAGNDKPIDAVQVYYYTPDDVRPYKKAKYKVNNYDWQYDDETMNGQDGFAGVFGLAATKFQITIE